MISIRIKLKYLSKENLSILGSKKYYLIYVEIKEWFNFHDEKIVVILLFYFLVLSI